MSAWAIVIGLAVPVLSLVGAVLNGLWVRSAGRQSADNDFMGEVREWTELRLAERDRRIDALGVEIKAVRAELNVVSVKYRVSLAFGRHLYWRLRDVAPSEDIEGPPDEILSDFW